MQAPRCAASIRDYRHVEVGQRMVGRGRVPHGAVGSKQWKQFDKMQQRAAGKLQDAANKINAALAFGAGMKRVVKNFEKVFGEGSATRRIRPPSPQGMKRWHPHFGILGRVQHQPRSSDARGLLDENSGVFAFAGNHCLAGVLKAGCDTVGSVVSLSTFDRRQSSGSSLRRETWIFNL
jgi:hypothetical protein